VQFSGAVYHVTARGNERKPISRDERDRAAQVATYEGGAVRWYCRLTNVS